MTTNDHDGDDQRQSLGDTDEPTRDARGRWRPGYCPNRKGRPKVQKQKPGMLYDEADIRIFSHTLVEVTANGHMEMMDRRTALLNKMFESAMKGKVSMQRFLYMEFERNAERLGAARAHYSRLIFDWILDNPEFGKDDFDMPLEVEAEIESLRNMLNYYFPDQYPPAGTSANDDGDSQQPAGIVVDRLLR